MFNVKDNSFSKAPLEASPSCCYEPFFARKPSMYPSSYCSASQSHLRKFNASNQETRQTFCPEGIGSLLMDDYPDPDSPYESDSDDDRLYIDLDPPANYQRRVSVNCFTTPFNKVVLKDELELSAGSPSKICSNLALDIPKDKPKDTIKDKSKEKSIDQFKDKFNEKSLEKPVERLVEKPKEKSMQKCKEKCVEKSKDRSGDKPIKHKSSQTELNEKVKKSHGSKRKKRKTFVDQASQTEFEYIIPAKTSSMITQINLEQGKEVVPVHRRRKRLRGRGGMRDRSWPKQPFQSEGGELCYAREEPPTKKQRGHGQDEDDSDMDPPIRTIT